MAAGVRMRGGGASMMGFSFNGKGRTPCASEQSGGKENRKTAHERDRGDSESFLRLSEAAETWKCSSWFSKLLTTILIPEFNKLGSLPIDIPLADFHRKRRASGVQSRQL
jgi:hypothetical protein